MMLTDGDRLVIAAALKAQAMIYGEQAKRDYAAGKKGEASTKAAFSGECARLGELFHAAKA